MLFGWVQFRPLHLILGGEAVELRGEDGGELGIIEVVRIDCPRPDGYVLLGCLIPERGRPGARAGVGPANGGDKRGKKGCGLHGFDCGDVLRLRRP